MLNFILLVYCLGSPCIAARERRVESGYMPHNVSELKSGGGAIPMLSPHPEKWLIDARAYVSVFRTSKMIFFPFNL